MSDKLTPEQKAEAEAKSKALADEAKKTQDVVAAAEKAAGEKLAETAKKTGLVPGKMYRLRAVHGDIIHPFQDHVRIGTEDSKKLVADAWVLTQFEAGKLALDTDD